MFEIILCVLPKANLTPFRADTFTIDGLWNILGNIVYMRVCPQCNTQYSDDTLKYCLQDGTPLSVPTDQGMPTLVIPQPEVETDPRGKRIDVPVTPTSGGHQRDPASATMGKASENRSKLPIAIAAAVLGTLLLVGIGALAAWLYFSRQGTVTNTTVSTNTGPRTSTPNTAANTQPVASPTKTATIPKPEPERNVNDKEIKQQVSQILMDWRAETEDLDIDSYMDHYAPRVDYYNRSGVSSAVVRADKQRAFSRYDSVKLDISDLSITTDPSGETATAEFDKEWNFSGKSNSSGKVRQMIKFRNIDGEWLITAEKDLKVYYTR